MFVCLFVCFVFVFCHKPQNTSILVLKSWKEFKYETFNSKEDILNQHL